jgi:hypothetical protein
VRSDCSSLEVCSLTNQGRYLQRLTQGDTITFELNAIRLLVRTYKASRKKSHKREHGKNPTANQCRRELRGLITSGIFKLA